MAYVTPSQVLAQFSAEEIAQRADRGIPRLVTAGMLAAAAAGQPLDDYTPEEQAATVGALDILQAKLGDTDGVIDGYLAGRYNLPLAATPRLLLVIACDLVRYALYDDQVTEVIEQRYKDAIRMLEQIAKGTITLGVGLEPSPEVDGVKYCAPPKVFNAGALEGY